HEPATSVRENWHFPYAPPEVAREAPFYISSAGARQRVQPGKRQVYGSWMASTVISAVGTPPSTAGVTVTSAGSGCADSNSRSCRRCSLTSLSAGKGEFRRGAHGGSRLCALTWRIP